MITPDDIAVRATRAYMPFLRGWLRGEAFVPLVFPAGTPPADYHALRDGVAKLLGGAKGARSRGYRVEQETRQTRALGAQSLPTRVVIDTPGDLLHLAGRADEFAAFAADVALIRAGLPLLEGWLRESPQHVLAQHGTWPELLRVCAYFYEHPRPGRYIRELPIEVHTKFIEGHTGILRRLLDALLPPESIAHDEPLFERRYGLRSKEPLVRLRLLDPALQTRYAIPLAELAAPVSLLATLHLGAPRCLIVENEMTFLTLPPLAETIALWGGGFAVDAVAGLLWLRACPIWYWGDLDAQGFQILSRLRALLPHATSLLMDEIAFEAFHEFAVVGTPCAVSALPHLSEEEQSMFAWLARGQLRLEQEHITQAYVVERLHAALG